MKYVSPTGVDSFSIRFKTDIEKEATPAARGAGVA
jgi:hypothetical protein